MSPQPEAPRLDDRLVDTHSHLFVAAFDADRAQAMARAQKVCSAVVLPNIDVERLPRLLELAEAYPGFAFPTLGLHPCDVTPHWKAHMQQLEAHLPQRSWFGIGETGLDAHWSTLYWDDQLACLARHCALARELDLPLVLHSRSAFEAVARVVEAHQDGRLRGVFHCFTDGLPEARRVQDLGFCLGIGGVATYPKANLLPVLQQADRQRVVLETDSPYLAPVPHRGKRNETAFLPFVAQTVAQAWGCSPAEVAETTTRTARQLFGLPQPNPKP